MSENKLMKLNEAIAEYVKPGMLLYLSGAQHGEPSAAIHEIVRQNIGNLRIAATLIHTMPLLIGSGLVSDYYTAFVQQEPTGFYFVKRAQESGKYPKIHEYSHHSLCLALLAGKMNVPFLPTQVTLGSDIKKYNKEISEVFCPFTGQKYAAVKALQPDLCILHVQRADRNGNAQKWGSLGLDSEGIGASKKVIVIAEEIVDSDVIQREPNLTVVPGFRVDAVVHEPMGAYPLHLSGCYNGDVLFFEQSIRTQEGFEAYVETYIRQTKDWKEYLRRIEETKGEGYFQSVKVQNPIFSEPIRTGY